MTHNPNSAAGQAAHPRRWRALALLGSAQLMLILDVTVVTVAMPELAAGLGLGRQDLTWVMSAYTLAFGGLMLTGGRLADIVGPRRMVVTGLVLFALASLLAGFAWDPVTILSARAVQGVGAALLSPAALSTVVRLFSGEEQNRALGIWSALGGSGAAVGVLLGGLLTAGPGWHWVFWINVPVAAVVIAALPRVLPPLPPRQPGARLDLAGAALGTAAVGVLIYAFIDAGDTGWTSPGLFVLLGVALVLGLLLRWRLRASRHPLVSPALLVRPPVVAGSFVIAVGTALMVAVFFLGTFYLQELAGYGPLVTGLLFLPVAAAAIAGAQLAGRLIGRWGAQRLGVLGLGIAAAGMAVAGYGAGVAVMVTAVSIATVGLGIVFVVASVTALATVAPQEAGVASGLLSTFHEVGASLGAAVMSGVAAGSLIEGSADGFGRGYLAAAGIAVVGAAVTWGLLNRAGRLQPEGE